MKVTKLKDDCNQEKDLNVNQVVDGRTDLGVYDTIREKGFDHQERFYNNYTRFFEIKLIYFNSVKNPGRSYWLCQGPVVYNTKLVKLEGQHVTLQITKVNKIKII